MPLSELQFEIFAAQSKTYYTYDKVLRLRANNLIENAARPNDNTPEKFRANAIIIKNTLGRMDRTADNSR